MRQNTNLLEETLEFLKQVGKTEEDVLFVMESNKLISFKDFKSIANIEYYAGFGSQKINSTLVVVGKDWWLEREEYDGSEGWAYKEKPKKNKSTIELNSFQLSNFDLKM